MSATGEQYHRITFNEPPATKPGACHVTPANGTADVTVFSIKCDSDAFVDPDVDLTYSVSRHTSLTDPGFTLKGPCMSNPIQLCCIPFGIRV